MFASRFIVTPLCGLTRGRFTQILRAQKQGAQDDKNF
jgi:hypothetical protein